MQTQVGVNAKGQVFFREVVSEVVAGAVVEHVGEWQAALTVESVEVKDESQ